MKKQSSADGGKMDALQERESVKIENHRKDKLHESLYPHNAPKQEEVTKGPDDGFCETAFMRLKKDQQN